MGTGDTLVINCTLNNTGASLVDANSIFFKFGNDRLNAEYVRVVDDSTAQLRLANMTRSQSSAHIFCYAVGPSGETIYIKNVAIQVAGESLYLVFYGFLWRTRLSASYWLEI